MSPAVSSVSAAPSIDAPYLGIRIMGGKTEHRVELVAVLFAEIEPRAMWFQQFYRRIQSAQLYCLARPARSIYKVTPRIRD